MTDMTAEQFELAWRQGRRRFPGVTAVEVSPAYVEGWERRTRALRLEREERVAFIEADLNRRGNYRVQARVDELDAEMWTLALVRNAVFRINDAAAAA
jgi:hypothetical protein